MTSRLALALLITLLPSCGGDPTRIVVVVDSDLALASVYARSGEPGCTGCEHDFALAGEGAVTVPFSFVLEPRDGDASREVRLRVEGRDAGGAAIVSRTVRTGFVAGRTSLLHVLLEAACRGEACPAGTTCIGGGCADDAIDPATLPEVEPGRELERDGAVDPDAAIEDGGSELPRGCGTLDSGSIRIDPDGPGGDDPFEAICDPSDGGGWVLIANVAAMSASLGYAAPIWTGDVGDADPTPGVSPADQGLFRPYWLTPVGELRFVMIDGSATMRSRVAALTRTTTLRDAMTAGDVGLSGAPADWAGLVGAGAGSRTCDVAGIGVSMVRARIRIGALCTSSTSAEAFFGVAAEVVPGGGPCDSPSASSPHTGGWVFCGPSGTRIPYPAQALVYGRATGG